MNTPIPPEVMDAWTAACSVRLRAYAPYSRYQVGAALRVAGHPVLFLGTNVENASYGATLCAERNAICQAVAACGPRPRMDFMVLVTASRPAAAPCGLCRQVLIEFCAPEFRLYLATPEGIERCVLLGELLPCAFGPRDLDDTHAN